MKKFWTVFLVAVVVFGGIAAGMLLGIQTEEANVKVVDEGGKVLAEINTQVDRGREIQTKLLYGGDYSKLYEKKQGEDFSFFDEKVSKTLEEELGKYTVPPKDAEVVFNANESQPFEFLREKSGREIDVEKAVHDLKNMKTPSGVLEVSYREVPPKLSVEDLRKDCKLLAEFTTNYASSSDARKHNIRLAADKLNGVVISGGGVLSFNEIVGQRSQANGFQKAKIIQNGEFIDGFGGGVCQASTTLFNAWIRAGLSVAESRSHSLPVSYVGIGWDATVSSNSDLKLENNSKTPVYVQTFADNEKIKIKIFGQDNGVKAEFSEKLIRTFLPDPLYEAVGAGEDVLTVQEYREGKMVRLVGKYYKDGKLIEEKIIQDGYYSAKRGKIFYGTLSE